MPYLKIQTNSPVTDDTGRDLLRRASALVAEKLGKSENYVMVALDPPRPMMFAGDDAPTAFLALKSIGLDGTQTGELSSALCELISEELDIEPERIYIEFADAARNMWGWNGRTF